MKRQFKRQFNVTFNSGMVMKVEAYDRAEAERVAAWLIVMNSNDPIVKVKDANDSWRR